MSKVSRKRHLAKTLTWRILATADTVLLGWFVTGSLSFGMKIGGFEVLTKMLLYYAHERAWYKYGHGFGTEPEDENSSKKKDKILSWNRKLQRIEDDKSLPSEPIDLNKKISKLHCQ